MADVAGLLASAIVTQVGAKLGSVIGDQVSMLCCFEDDMEDMKATLESMEAVLEDAEKKRSIKEEEVRLWLKRLNNAALDISDMIDESHTDDSKQTHGKVCSYLSTIMLQITGSFPKRLSTFFSITCSFVLINSNHSKFDQGNRKVD